MTPSLHTRLLDPIERYTTERGYLLAALGEITSGGTIEAIAHIGSSSVPGLATTGGMDIALSVYPFPLAGQQLPALHDLGYTPIAEGDDATLQRFAHQNGETQLWVREAGDMHWLDPLLLRDWLLTSEDARHSLQQRRAAFADNVAGWQSAKAQIFQELGTQAHHWWIAERGFAPLHAITEELAELSAPWYISSGWALDLFLGRVTRAHHDVDVVLDREDQLLLQGYLSERGWKFVTPYNQRLEAWPLHMRIALPRHQVHAHREGEFIDFLLTDLQPTVWHYRRNPLIVRHRERAFLTTSEGIRYLAPELVLLFKARSTSGKERGKDHEDFRNVYPQLEAEPRAWLRWALTATEPEHGWLELL